MLEEADRSNFDGDEHGRVYKFAAQRLFRVSALFSEVMRSDPLMRGSSKKNSDLLVGAQGVDEPA